MSNSYVQGLEVQLQKYAVDTKYSYVGHFQAAQIYSTTNQRIAVSGAIAGFLAGGSLLILLANLFPNSSSLIELIGAILGTYL